MSRARKIVRLVFVSVVALLVLAAAGLFAYSRTDAARDRLREEVVRTVREQLGLEVSFSDVELELVPPRVHVLGASVEGSDHSPIVTVERITIGLQTWALVQGRVEMSEISLEHPQARLIVEGNRVVNLPRVRSREGGGGSAGTVLRDVGVLAGSIAVHVRDAPGGDLKVELTDVNLDVTAAESGAYDVRLLVSDGSVRQHRNRREIDLIEGRVLIGREQAVARRVRVRMGDLRLAVARATIGRAAPHDVEGSAEIWLPLDLVRELPLRAPPLRGELHATVEGSRRSGQMSLGGRVEVRGLVIGPERVGTGLRTFGPHAIGDVASDFAYTDDRLSLPEVVIDRLAEGDGLIVARNLEVGLGQEDLPISADVRLEGFELARVLIDAGLYASRVRLQIDGTVPLVGTLRPLELRMAGIEFAWHDFAALTASITKPDARPIIEIARGRLRGTVVVTRESVRLEGLAVAFGSTSLGVDAELRIARPREWWLRASSAPGAFDFGDIGALASLPVQGVGSVQAFIRGRYSDPEIDGRVDLEGFRLGSVEFGHVLGPVHYRQRVIDLPRTEGTRGESRYRFDEGRIAFLRGGLTVDGTAQLESVRVSDAVEMFHMQGTARQVQAQVTGAAQVSYRGRRWAVDASGSLEGAAFGEQRLGAGEFDVRYDGGDVDIRRFVVRDQGAQASIVGRVPRAGPLALTFDLSGLPTQAIAALPTQLRPLRGTLGGHLEVAGTGSALQGEGWIEMPTATFNRAALGRSRLNIALDGRTLRGRGRIGQRLVRIDELTLGLDAPRPLRVRARLRDLELLQFLDPEDVPSGMTARTTGALDVTVSLARRNSLAGEIRLDSILVNQPGFAVTSQEPVTLRLDGDRVAWDPARLAVRSESLGAETGFSLGGWVGADALAVELRGELDLGLVASVSEPIDEMSGTMRIDCQIGGSPRQPVIMGEARVEGARLVVAGLSYPFEDLAGTARFSSNVVLLEDVTASFLGGELSGSGRVRLAGLRLGSYHLDLRVRDASLRVATRSSAVVNAALALDSPAAEDSQPLLSGEVEFVRFRYLDPMRIAAELDVDELSRRRRTEVRTFDPEGDRLRLDIRLRGEGNLRVENNLARADVTIDDQARPFRLVGTNQAYGLVGTLMVEPHSTVTFRNTEFDVEQGVLEFDSAYQIDPALNFVANAVRRDWLLTLRASGTSSRPVIELTSDPPLSEDDILLLMTVGLTREETERLGYDAAASSVLPEVLWNLSGIDDEVSRLVPMLDEFRVTTDYSTRTGRLEPRVSIGGRLTDRMRLGASAGLSESRDFQTNLEVQISEGLSFEATYGNDADFMLGNIGGDIKWRVEF